MGFSVNADEEAVATGAPHFTGEAVVAEPLVAFTSKKYVMPFCKPVTVAATV
jgi:hypothetical protein